MTVRAKAEPAGTINQGARNRLSLASLIIKPQLGWGSVGPKPRKARPDTIIRPMPKS